MIGLFEDFGDDVSPTDNSERIEGGPIGLKESTEVDADESKFPILLARHAALPVRMEATREKDIDRSRREVRLFIAVLLYLNLFCVPSLKAQCGQDG